MHSLVTQRLAYLQLAITFLAIVLQSSVAVVSECSDKSKITALGCIDMVLKEIGKEFKVKKLMVWSDGCTSQFRSRFVFKLLSSYRPELLLE